MEAKLKRGVDNLMVGHRYEVMVWGGGTERLYYLGELNPERLIKHYSFGKTPDGEETEAVTVRDRIYREVESDEGTLTEQAVTAGKDIGTFRPNILTPDDGLQSDYRSLVPVVAK